MNNSESPLRSELARLVLIGAVLLPSLAHPSTAVAGDDWWDVVEDRHFDDRLLDESTQVERDEALTYEIEVKAKGSTVSLRPTAQRFCTERALARVERTEIIHRASADPTTLRKATTIGVVGTVLGGALVALAARDGFDFQNGSDGGMDVYLTLSGGAGVVAGGRFLVPSLVTAGRARDTENHLGEITLTNSTERTVCEDVDLTGASIEIVGTEVRGTVEDDGRWVIDLDAVDALDGLAEAEQLRIANDSLPPDAAFPLPDSFTSNVKRVQRERAYQAVIRGEIDSGSCTEQHLRAMQSQVEFLDGQYDWGVLVDHEIFVIDGSSTIRYTAGLPGTYRLWALGVDPVSLHVENSRKQSQPVDQGAIAIVQGGHLAGVRFVANTAETFSVSLQGNGCAVMTVLMK